jgi:hypothetical protein
MTGVISCRMPYVVPSISNDQSLHRQVSRAVAPSAACHVVIVAACIVAIANIAPVCSVAVVITTVPIAPRPALCISLPSLGVLPPDRDRYCSLVSSRN